nr:hypothetical protein [Paraburkholderia fungorum]
MNLISNANTRNVRLIDVVEARRQRAGRVHGVGDLVAGYRAKTTRNGEQDRQGGDSCANGDRGGNNDSACADRVAGVAIAGAGQRRMCRCRCEERRHDHNDQAANATPHDNKPATHFLMISFAHNTALFN